MAEVTVKSCNHDDYPECGCKPAAVLIGPDDGSMDHITPADLQEVIAAAEKRRDEEMMNLARIDCPACNDAGCKHCNT